MIYLGSPIKSLIVEFLAENQFSCAKEIVSAVQKYMNKKTSFQAVYKQLGALIAEGVIQKHNKYYTFSMKYLNTITRFQSKLIDAVSYIHNINEVVVNAERGRKIEYTCNSLQEVQDISRRIEKGIMYRNSFCPKVVRYFQHYSSYFFAKSQDIMRCIDISPHVHTYIYGYTSIDHAAYKDALRYTDTVYLSKRKLEQDGLSEYTVIDDFVLEVSHADDHYNNFVDKLSQESIEAFPSIEYMNYRKFSYYPLTLKVHKDPAQAKVVKDMICNLEM
jgi:Fe2+ or Zn2+ uptake regulation protein